MDLFCKVGLHEYAFMEHTHLTYPKRGPYDPSNDASRTIAAEKQVCVLCGKQRVVPNTCHDEWQ